MKGLKPIFIKRWLRHSFDFWNAELGENSFSGENRNLARKVHIVRKLYTDRIDSYFELVKWDEKYFCVHVQYNSGTTNIWPIISNRNQIYNFQIKFLIIKEQKKKKSVNNLNLNMLMFFFYIFMVQREI